MRQVFPGTPQSIAPPPKTHTTKSSAFIKADEDALIFVLEERGTVEGRIV